METKERQRTIQQNRSLHLYCQQLSNKLNEAGISQRVLLEGLEIDNSEESIKDIFRSLGRAKYQKSSTSMLTTIEIGDCYEELNRHIAHLGIHVPWPSQEEILYQQDLSKLK